MKKITSFLLIIVLCFSLFPHNVIAAETTEFDFGDENAPEEISIEDDEISVEDSEVSIEEDDSEMGHLLVNVKDSNVVDRKITFTWDEFENTDKYQVYKVSLQGEEQTLELFEEVTQNECTILFDDLGVFFEYKIFSLDNFGKKIAESDIFKIGFPVNITEISTTGISKTKVKVEWDLDPNTTSYMVYFNQDKKDEVQYVETVENSVEIPVSFGLKYYFRVCPVYKTLKSSICGNSKRIKYSNIELVSLSHQKYSYSEMTSDIKGLCAKYNDYLEYKVIGETKNKRKIYDVILGDPNASKSILVVASIHAREYVATVNCMKQLEYYLLNYNKKIDGKLISDVFSKVNIHYVMMANPDGVTIAQKNNIFWKANANGVNLNSNFPYKFKKRGSKKRGTYTGSKAGSEKETKAIMSLTNSLKASNTLAVVNYHAAGQIVFGNYKGSNSFVKKYTKKMYNEARKTTGYRDAGYYNDSAGYREYVLYKIKSPCITIELGHSGCPISKKQYYSIYKKNRLVILRQAKLFI